MDHVARLWDSATGRPVRTLSGHTGVLRTLGFHPGGAWLVSGSYDKTARLWEIATGRTIRTFGPFPQTVAVAVFSPDGKTLALVCMDRAIVHFVDPVTGIERHKQRIPDIGSKPRVPGEVYGCFNHKGDRLLLDLSEGCWMFDGATGRVLTNSQGRAVSPVGGMFSAGIFTPDDSQFVLHTKHALTFYDAGSLRVVDRIPDPANDLDTIEIGNKGDGAGNKGDLLVAGSRNGWLIKLWDLRSRQELRTLFVPIGSATDGCISLSPDSRILAWGDTFGRVRLWYNLLGDKVTTCRVRPAAVDGQQQLQSLVLDPTGRTLAVGCRDGGVALVDVPSRRILRSLKGSEDPIYCVAYSRDGRALAAGSADGRVRVWNTLDDRPVHDLGVASGQVFAVAFDPAGRRLAAAGEDGSLMVWDAASGRLELTLPKVHEAPIHGVAFSPDGSTLATAGGDQTVQLRDARSGSLLRTLRRDPARSEVGPFYSVAFSPDGREIVAACSERVAVVWDTRRGSVRHTLTGHVDKVRQATFSPDGKRVVTAGQDGSIKIWDAVLGTETLELRHGAPVAATVLSPDGYQLIAAGWDGLVVFWDGTPITREGAFVARKASPPARR